MSRFDAHAMRVQSEQPSNSPCQTSGRCESTDTGYCRCVACWRDNGSPCSDMRGSDMRGFDMRGSDMRGSDMRGSDMRGSPTCEAPTRKVFISTHGKGQGGGKPGLPQSNSLSTHLAECAGKPDTSQGPQPRTSSPPCSAGKA